MKKDCQYYRELFPAYLEGRLGATTRREIAAHLNECRQCAAQFSNEWRNDINDGYTTKPAESVVRKPRKGILALLGGGGKRIHIGIILLGGIILFAMYMQKKIAGVAGNQPTPTTNQQLGAEQTLLLAEALVSLRREYPTTGTITQRRKVKGEVYGFLEQLKKSLQGKTELLGSLLHQDFILAQDSPGTGNSTFNRETVLKEQYRLKNQIDQLSDFYWWDWNEETLTLWAFGENDQHGTLMVLRHRNPTGERIWQLFYLNFKTQGISKPR